MQKVVKSNIDGLKFKILNFLYSKDLRKIKSMMKEGKLEQALKELSEQERRIQLNNNNLLQNHLLKCQILIELNDHEKGLLLAEELVLKGKEIKDPSILLKAGILKIKSLSAQGKYDDCFECIEEEEKTIDNFPIEKQLEFRQERALLKSNKGMIYRKKGDLNLALNNFQEALSIQMELKHDLPEIANLLNQIGIIFASKGELDQALNSLTNSLRTYEEIGDERPTIRLFNNIGLIYGMKGESEKALEYYQKSLDLSDKYGNIQISATLSLNIGLIYSDKGELDKALEYTERSLNLYEELGESCIYEMATCLNNIGLIHETRGELDKALEAYNKSSEQYKVVENKHGIATTINNIANIYKIRGELEKAATNYKESLALFETIGSNIDTGLALYNIITLNVERGLLKEAEEYLEKLKIINETEENKKIAQYFRISKAVIFKTSDRVVHQAEAQRIFQEISEEEIVRHETTVEAMLYLCEMLITELRTTGTEEVLNEIKSLLDRLMKIAKDQNSFSTLINTQILQSRIALIELDLEKSRNILNQAQSLAEEKGLKNVAMAVSREYDHLLDQLGKWTDLIDKNVGMIEKLEMTEIEDMITRIVRKRGEIPEFTEEEPALFFMLSDSGKILFSKQFALEGTLDEKVIGDLMTAINSFIQETFATTGTIERLKHKEHIVLMKPIGSIFTCYVFKGPSYSAIQKLDNFIEKVKGTSSLWEVIKSTKVEDNLIDDPIIDKLVTNIFISS